MREYLSPRWQELGYSSEQARAYYQPDEASREALQVLQERGLLSFDPLGRWRRVAAFPRVGPPLLSYQSPFQKIELYRSGANTGVFLNGTIQLESQESHYHNEMMVGLPLSLIPEARKVLILGGGFGMGACCALAFPEVESIEVVEVDEHVLRLAQHSRSLRDFNRKSLLHPKVSVWVGDAFDYLGSSGELYDLIVFDCDLTATRQSRDLTLEGLVEFFRALQGRLRVGGAVTTRIPIDEGYMDLVDEVGGFDAQLTDSQRAQRLVSHFWPHSQVFEFLSVFCGRELLVVNFPDHQSRPTVRRRLPAASSCYQQVLDELFPGLG